MKDEEIFTVIDKSFFLCSGGKENFSLPPEYEKKKISMMLVYLYKYLFMQPIKAKREFFNPLILLVLVAKFFLAVII